jgi:RNA polymerase sigma-70 factor (ECF subfamily)
LRIDLATASDAALVVAIGRYHEPALAETYRRHGGAVRALAQRVVGSGFLADEVTQDVFLRLWREPEQFDATRSGLRTYLVAIAHHRAVDLVRSESARAAREQRSAEPPDTTGYDVEHLAWDLAMAEQVRVALDRLPNGERDAIQLAYFEGRTYREVASLLGEPEGTVKSRIRAGLQRMQRSLAAHRTDHSKDGS